MQRWADELDAADAELELGLECSECGRFSGPVARGWLTRASGDADERFEPLVALCPVCARRGFE
jgi:hypothetical protein